MSVGPASRRRRRHAWCRTGSRPIGVSERGPLEARRPFGSMRRGFSRRSIARLRAPPVPSWVAGSASATYSPLSTDRPATFALLTRPTACFRRQLEPTLGFRHASIIAVDKA
jgi:hypothetical protein